MKEPCVICGCDTDGLALDWTETKVPLCDNPICEKSFKNEGNEL